MKKVIFILGICLNLFSLNAQVKISGKVVSKDNQPMEFVVVALFSDTDSNKLLKNELTNEKGEFNLDYKVGIYKLAIHSFNAVVYSKELVLDKDMDLGTIQVNNETVLEAITITSKKDIIVRKNDRLVFNIENTIATTGGDALDALKITPGLLVQNDNINMVGKSSVRVLIDDRIVELDEVGLSNLLKSIPAGNIKTIEVITTPLAKYEAAGNSGLINIKLKKAKKDAWSLSIGGNYIHRAFDDEGAMISNYMFNKGKLSLNASLNYRNGGETFIYKDLINFPDEIWNSNQMFNRHNNRLNGMLSMNYVATPKWTLGFQYLTNYNEQDATREGKVFVTDYTRTAITKNVSSLTDVNTKPVFNSINMFNEFKLDTFGRKMILNLDYFNYSNIDIRPYDGSITINDPFSTKMFVGNNSNQQNTNNFSGKVDFELPTKFLNWSFGGKISFLKTDNDISAFNSGLVDNPIGDYKQLPNTFEYDENIQAIYFSGEKNISKNLEVQFGLRIEATQTKSYTENLEQALNNQYTKFFPTMNVSYKLKENSRFRLGYSKRIERPNYASLNPNVTFISPFLSVAGNPFLQPSFIDNFEIGYSYKKLESTLFYSMENNLSNQIGIPDTNTYYVPLTYRNMFNIKRYGISEIYTFNTVKWWTSNNSFAVNYSTSEAINIPAVGVNGFYVTLTSNNDFILNKKKTLLYNLNISYIPIGTWGINRLESRGSASFTIQYLLMNKNLKIALKANDFLRTDRMRFGSTVNDVYRLGDYYSDTRYVQLSLNYNLGNNKVKVRKRETGNQDERTRTGN